MKKQKRVISFLLACILALNLGVSFSENVNAEAASKKYVVKINKSMNCVTIYEKKSSGKLKPVKAMICSAGSATPIGTFPLGEKMRWHTLMGPSYGQYCSRIHGGILSIQYGITEMVIRHLCRQKSIINSVRRHLMVV